MVRLGHCSCVGGAGPPGRLEMLNMGLFSDATLAGMIRDCMAVMADDTRDKDVREDASEKFASFVAEARIREMRLDQFVRAGV